MFHVKHFKIYPSISQFHQLMREQAIKEEAISRLRPILMTTFAIPLAIARGAGCEIRIPLGTVIAGGMTVGTHNIHRSCCVYIYRRIQA